jgi:hypothetical protein
MKYALRRLGYSVYGMGEVVQYYSHLNAWYGHARGERPADIPALLASYDATVGQPCMFFPDDMLNAFPDSLVIINTREPAAWFKSYRTFVSGIKDVRRKAWFLPRIRAVHRTLAAVVFDGRMAGHNDDQAYCVAAIEDLRARARKRVPPERVLEYSVTEGWEPLCKFLGAPVPAAPFPHRNKNENEVKARIALAISRDAACLAIAALIVYFFGISWLSAAALAAGAAVWLLLYRLRLA